MPVCENPDITVAEYATRWLEAIAREIKPRTLESYRQILTLYASEHRDTLRLTPEMLERLSDADLQRIYDGEDPEFVIKHPSRQTDVGPPAATAAMVTS